MNFVIDLAHRRVSVASERGIRCSEVRFLMGTQNIFFVPRSWQDEKHLSWFFTELKTYHLYYFCLQMEFIVKDAAWMQIGIIKIM